MLELVSSLILVSGWLKKCKKYKWWQYGRTNLNPVCDTVLSWFKKVGIIIIIINMYMVLLANTNSKCWIQSSSSAEGTGQLSLGRGSDSTTGHTAALQPHKTWGERQRQVSHTLIRIEYLCNSNGCSAVFFEHGHFWSCLFL